MRIPTIASSYDQQSSRRLAQLAAATLAFLLCLLLLHLALSETRDASEQNAAEAEAVEVAPPVSVAEISSHPEIFRAEGIRGSLIVAG